MIRPQLTRKEVDLVHRLLDAMTSMMNQQEATATHGDFAYRDTSKFTDAAYKNFADRQLISSLRRKLL